MSLESISKLRLWVYRLIAFLVIPFVFIICLEGGLRLLGVGMQNLEVESEADQAWLFAPLDKKRRLLSSAQDRIKDKHGENLIHHARALKQDLQD